MPATLDEGELIFSGSELASYERHLVCDHIVRPNQASLRDRFEALALSIRDLLAERWLATREAQERANPKRVYYLSMEFLIGRSLVANVTNLGMEPIVREALARDGIDWLALAQTELDAGLGNGGLGRLAACFMDSLATLQIPAMGYGLRYDFGIFHQEIRDGYQVEQPDNWLINPDPWEVVRPNASVHVPLASSFRLLGGDHEHVQHVPDQSFTVVGIPYDRPMVGYGGKTVNTLRLWRAATPNFFDFNEFSSGDFVGAIVQRAAAATITRVLYPNDATSDGRRLRFIQEYFLVACSLADILKRFRKTNKEWAALPDKVAIHLNDTHPSVAVAELMRILLDEARLAWDTAWDLTTRTLAYTNHTLLPEALEKWPVEMFEQLLPRHLEIVFEINRRLVEEVRRRYPGDPERVQRISLIEEGSAKQVRMAHLAVVGTHSTNGVAEIHSRLLRTHLLPELAELFPERFNNKTNGVTPRRWLLAANPELSGIITEAIGAGWITDLGQLRKLLPLADDAAFRAKFGQAKRDAKVRFANWLRESTGQSVDPDSIFDCQIKRIHAYKRQLLNVLHIIFAYELLRKGQVENWPPRTFFFSGKAAPAYQLAKLIIKLINCVAEVIDNDPAVRGKLKVVFLPDYCVTLAERLIPASDVSEQISTAGFEASGTSNMKFMMNGALTIGTRDGATIEMAEEAGAENFFLFGLTAEQVASSRSWYDPHWHYQHEPETRAALDAIFSNRFNPHEPGIFEPIREALLGADYYMHLADLRAYIEAQLNVAKVYRDKGAWMRKAIINVACSGKFSSDRSIAEYAADIWKARPCPVEAPATFEGGEP